MSIKNYSSIVNVSNEGLFGFGEYTITKVILNGSSRNSPIYKTLRLCSDVLTSDYTLSEALNIDEYIKYMISETNKEVTKEKEVRGSGDKTEKVQETTKKTEISLASELTEIMEASIRENFTYLEESNRKLKEYEAEMNHKGPNWRKVGYWEIPGLFRNSAHYQHEVKNIKLTIDKGISQVKLVEKYGVPSDTISKVIKHLEDVKDVVDKAVSLLDKNVMVVKGNQLSSYGI